MRRPLLLLAPAAAALLCACGPHVDLAVDLRSVSITVPKVVSPAQQIVAPSAPQPVALPPVPVTPTQVLAQAPVPTAAPTVSVAPAPAPVVAACPKADQLAAPDVAAGVLVRSIPEAETFVQKQSGAFSGSTATPAAGSLVRTATTTITRQPQTTSTVGQVLDNWSVLETDAVTGASQVELYQLAESSASPAATTPGVYLTGLAWKDPVRGDLTFVPAQGIRIVPVPVTLASPTIPTQYFTSSTDAANRTTMVLSGNVTGKARVDVCGKVVDSYTVDLTGVLTSPTATYQVHWVKQIATQYGAQDVQNQLVLTDTARGTSFDRTLVRTTVPKAPSGAQS